MKIYIAAKYARRFELRDFAKELERRGHELTCQWLWNGEEEKSVDQAALMDVADVERADVLIFFGEPQASHNRGGGRWFEFGYAYALGKKCVAVLNMDPSLGGHDHLPVGHESVFTALPSVLVATDGAMALDRVESIATAYGTRRVPVDLVLEPGGVSGMSA